MGAKITTQPSDTTQYSPASPYPSPTPSSQLGAGFVLGLIGAIMGMLIGIGMLFFSRTGDTINGTLIIQFIGATAFSVLAILAGVRIFDQRDTVNGLLMIVAAFGILASINIFGIISALLFFIGGALLLNKKA